MEEIWGHNSLKKKVWKLFLDILYMYLYLFALTGVE